MKSIKRTSVGMDVANEIRAAILEARLTPGSKIDQDELAAQLGVSRLPVRQALQILEREGLVYLDHGRGATVAPLDVKFLSDLLDCVAVMEGSIASLLASRKGVDLSGLRRVVQEGTGAAQRRELRPELALRFHALLYEMFGNQVLIGIMEPLRQHVHRLSVVLPALPRHEGEPLEIDGWREHSEIFEAIAAGDAENAGRLARLHVVHVRDEIISRLIAASAGEAGRFIVREHGQPAPALPNHSDAGVV